MSELGKPFLTKSGQKNLKKENQCKNAGCEQKTISEKIEKTVKIIVKLPHVKKPLTRKRNFAQTPFSHYFKIRAKIHAAKPLAFFAPRPVSA